MQTREQHLQWCKDRAIAELDRKDVDEMKAIGNATASFFSDIRKWEGGEVINEEVLKTMSMALFRFDMHQGREAVRRWIAGFT